MLFDDKKRHRENYSEAKAFAKAKAILWTKIYIFLISLGKIFHL